MSAAYQREYRQRITTMASTRVYATPKRHVPVIKEPKSPKTRKQGLKGEVFRMGAFSGDPSLRLIPRRV